MRLRPASLDDESRLLSWRNDPATRKANLSQKEIPRREYDQWLRQILADSRKSLLIAEINGKAVGTVRIDAEVDCVYLSWTIDPELRNRGLGTEMVEALSLQYNKPVKAVIRKYNTPSIRLACHLGMHLQRVEKDLLVYFRR